MPPAPPTVPAAGAAALRLSPYATVHPPLAGAAPVAGGGGSLLAAGTPAAVDAQAGFVLSHLFIRSARVAVSGAELRALTAPGSGARHRALPRARIRELVVHGILVPRDPGLAWRLRLAAGIGRVVVRSWGGLGDVVMTTPLLRAIRARAPATRIAVAAIGDDDFALLEHDPHVDEIWVREGDDAARTGAGDLVFEPRFGLLGPTRTASASIAHVIAGCLAVPLDSAKPELRLADADEAFGDRSARALGAFVAVHATSRRVQKDWPPERWRELRVPPGHALVQLGTGADLPVAGAHDLRGLPLRRSLAVLKRARAFVGVDSVLQHAAAAFGVPSVVLFGPTPPEVYGHPGSAAVRADCACHRDVGAWTRCERRCLAAVSAATVGAALDAALAAGPAASACAPGGER